jgi:cyanophycinase-like exopeptidase
MGRSLAIFCVFALFACGGSSAQQGSTTPQPVAAPPRMLLTAAGTRPAESLASFVGARGDVRPRVLVLSAGADTISGPRAAADLRAAGAIASSIRLTRAMAESGQISALLGGTEAVWLTGTNPRELGAALGGTATAVTLERRARAGLRMGGDGAGAGMLAAVLISGGDVPPPRRRTGRQPADEGVATAEGLGVLTGTLVYAPASPRHKPGALDSALASHQRLTGIQLDSGAALLVQSDGTWQSVGATDVLILVPDAAGADTTSAAARRMRVLSPGSRFDPRTRTMLPLQPATTR